MAALAVMAAPRGLPAATPVLVWSDEFNQAAGSAPNAANWSYDLGVGNPPGWGNNELESYTSSTGNAQIVADPNATDGKALAITAIEASGSYTSARIYTSKSFTACRLEARARMPAGAGVWPAFWALGANINTVGWPACGEVDVMEWGGSSLTPGDAQGSLHATNYNPTAVYALPANASFSDAYHVFAADCYPNEVVFSVDGTVYEDLKESAQPAGAAWPFDAPFFVLLNLAVGGNYPASPASTVFPQTYLVDYVRVYSLPPTPPPSLVWAPTPPAGVLSYSPAVSQISVSWQAPASTFGAALSGYTLQRAGDPAFTQNLTSWNLGTSTSYLDSTAQPGATYYYRVSAVSTNGASAPSAAALSAALESAGGSKLVNIATRGFVGTGANSLIAGFVVGGPSPKTVLIRASGPALAASPFNVPGTLPDPQLQLYSGSTVLESNAGWQGNAQVASAAAQVGAFAWTDPASNDAALLTTLSPGAYTAIVSGASGDSGVALLEVYDVQ
ncbi:MAG TPA: family 16 glycosylhydrolase [Opitutaceae bacterium]|nr:family 16 glycosylhydrolase [Opitutaceae bacterium]